jgi:predicted PhzF superfamily epimerase YddE/YHI9
VVLAGRGLSTEEMQRFARWTNLSETTFVLEPTAPEADYRVRIFTPVAELPFAGHPTLGTCHAWLEASPSAAAADDPVVQECGAGLVRVRRTEGGLAFAAPPLVRSGPVEDALIAHLGAMLGVEPEHIVDAQWVDNGPGWVAVLLESADAVLALPGAGRPRRRRRRATAQARNRSARGEGVPSQGRRHGGRSGHGQPQRLPGGMADPNRPREGSLRRSAGHGAASRRARPHFP